MRKTIAVTLLSMLFHVSSFAFPPSSPVGTWKGKLRDVFPITIIVKADGDKFKGTAILEAVVERESQVEVVGKSEAALEDVAFDGTTLAFKLVPNEGTEKHEIHGKLRLTGDAEADLEMSPKEGGPSMSGKMTKKE